MNKSFPKNFFWGASTASYQVEGLPENLKTNWTNFEHDPNRPKNDYDPVKYGPEQYICGSACDHWNRYKDDFTLAKELGHNATRCGSEPVRIMPLPGVIDHSAVEHYVDVVKYIRSLKMEPFFNLWHWTMPEWFEWLDDDALEHWEFYVRGIVPALSPYVTYWLTLNETNCYAGIGYKWGNWPPCHKSDEEYYIVLGKLAEAHKIAYKVIKECNPKALVGMAQNTGPRVATDNSEEQTAWLKDGEEWNFYFLDLIKDHQDFVGINNYGVDIYGSGPSKLFNDLGWGLNPSSIYYAIKIIWERYKLPVIITEHGLADSKDDRRGWFLFESMKWLKKAVSEEIPVFGYLHWSLMDNFEWAYGFWPRFGLIEIDREDNFARKPRPSVYLYRDIIKYGLCRKTIKRWKKIIAFPSGIDNEKESALYGQDNKQLAEEADTAVE